MKTWIERIIGLHWRTSLAGFLETVVAICLAYNFLPEETRTNPWMVTGTIAAAMLKTLKEFNIKDKQVSGTPATTQLVGSTPETLRAIPPEPSPDDKRVP